jgi:hypothetical protein
MNLTTRPKIRTSTAFKSNEETYHTCRVISLRLNFFVSELNDNRNETILFTTTLASRTYATNKQQRRSFMYVWRSKLIQETHVINYDTLMTFVFITYVNMYFLFFVLGKISFLQVLIKD